MNKFTERGWHLITPSLIKSTQISAKRHKLLWHFKPKHSSVKLYNVQVCFIRAFFYLRMIFTLQDITAFCLSFIMTTHKARFERSLLKFLFSYLFSVCVWQLHKLKSRYTNNQTSVCDITFFFNLLIKCLLSVWFN